MLNGLNPRAKFTLLLAMVSFAGTVLGWYALTGAMPGSAGRDVASRAQALLQSMQSARQYSAQNVGKHTSPLQDQHRELVSKRAPGFSALEFLRADGADFLYKEAALAPVNPHNKADAFETGVVERFRREPQLPEQSGFRVMGRRNVFFVARPIRVDSAACLACHHIPAALPPGMIKVNAHQAFVAGSGEVAGAQIVYVSPEAVVASGQRSAVVIAIFIALFALAVLGLAFYLRRAATPPTGSAQRDPASGRTALDGMSSPAPVRAGDAEIGRLNQQIGIEIVQRQHAEAALHDRQQRLDVLIERTPVACVGWKPDYTIISWNPAAERIFGFGAGEVVGRNAFEVFMSPDMKPKVDEFWRTQRAGATQHGLLRSRTKDGRKVTCEWYNTPLADSSGTIVEIISLAVDVTERNRARRELMEAKDAAEAASRAKSQFLANMSHEIRTPMNGVLGMAELLLASDLDEKPRRFAETIHHSGEALLAIINDILDFSKIESGKLELESVAFDLHAVMQDVAELLTDRAQLQGLELSCHVHPGVPLRIVGDPGRLRQVLSYLLANAVKFTERGEVVMEVRRTDAEGGTDECALQFSVTDTGIGIEPDKAKQLFQSFTQADNSTTRKYGGTGLGLAISQRLVAMMGGQIALASEPGQGSRFEFGIRARIAGDVAAAAAPCGELQGRRVLIVEDNATNRTILNNQTAGWGMSGSSAEHAAQALAMLRAAAARNTPYDLLIVDMKMPGMNGIELARAIQADASIAGSPAIMLTSIMISPSEAASARQAGIMTCLSKPVRQAELRRSIAEALGAVLPKTLLPAVDSSARRICARVLVAEDNVVNQEVARVMLTSFGCEVEVAKNGHAAVAAAQASRFDLILMDCELPGLDGFEATRELRGLEAAHAGDTEVTRMPIIALIDDVMGGDRERCIAAGMDDCLAKPIRKDQLWSMLTSVIGRGGAGPHAPRITVNAGGPASAPVASACHE